MNQKIYGDVFKILYILYTMKKKDIFACILVLFLLCLLLKKKNYEYFTLDDSMYGQLERKGVDSNNFPLFYR